MEQKSRGKLIVIDGTDGSGKKTQTQLLLDRLKQDGHNVASIAFPQYGEKSAGMVENYLNGKYGPPDALNPYIASLFYAIDRFDLSGIIRDTLHQGTHIITDRYVDANAGHQGGKFLDPKEREQYLTWLYDTEYRIFGIPKPDLVLILHLPAEMGQELVKKKQQRLYIEGGKTMDGHENNLKHLKAAENSYLWLMERFPEDHRLVECMDGDNLLSPEKIHQKVWEAIKPVLP